MASKNETVADAIKAIDELVSTLHTKECGEGCDIKDVWSLVQQVKNRIETAHKREVDKLIANLDAIETAMERVCSRDEIDEIITIKKREVLFYYFKKGNKQ